MKRQTFIISWIFLFLLSVSAWAAPTLLDRWEKDQRTFDFENEVSFSPIWRNLEDKEVLFFGGILNELANVLQYYFEDSLELLRNQRVATSYFGAKSNDSPESNAYSQAQMISKRYELLGRKQVLIGHSKGGLETLLMVLFFPELVLDGKVDRVVLIQSPVRGSPLANENSYNLPMRGASWFLKFGLTGLATSSTDKMFQKAFRVFEQKVRIWQAENQETHGWGSEREREELDRLKDEVSSRVFFVRSSYEKPFSLGIRITQAFSGRSLDPMGSNDGLVLTKDQYLKDFGTDLGVLVADHLTLVLAGPFSNGNPRARISFTHALLSHLY